jgi:hypothetical protein
VPAAVDELIAEHEPDPMLTEYSDHVVAKLADCRL